MKSLFGFLRDEQGQDLIEYALLVAFLAIVVVGFASGTRASLVGIAAAAGSKLTSANSAAAS